MIMPADNVCVIRYPGPGWVETAKGRTPRCTAQRRRPVRIVDYDGCHRLRPGAPALLSRERPVTPDRLMHLFGEREAGDEESPVGEESLQRALPPPPPQQPQVGYKLDIIELRGHPEPSSVFQSSPSCLRGFAHNSTRSSCPTLATALQSLFSSRSHWLASSTASARW